MNMSRSDNVTLDSNTSMSTLNKTFDYYDYEYEIVYLHEGFSFERPIYLYVWTILCVIVVISNVLIVLTLCRSSLRGSTNIVLAAIAIAETLAIVVTVPTFLYTYQQFEPGTNGALDVYILSKEWCEAFMTSRLYVSQVFNTASLWLHCLLGFQRFFSVWFPLRSHVVITRTRTALVTCLIFMFASVIHVYHLLDKKAKDNYMCVWRLEKHCASGCAYMWYSLFLVHVIPCVVLTTFTSMLLYKLFKTANDLKERELYSSSTSFERRNVENRTVTKVVVAVVICLLVPEIPHCVLLSVNVILRHSGMEPLPLKTNRTLQTSYEVLLACSYCANFWIYALLNKTFQKELKKLLQCFRGRYTPGHNEGLSQRSVVTVVEKTQTPSTNVQDSAL